MGLDKALLYVTLWPSFQHFRRFGLDDRVAGLRLNSAKASQEEVVQAMQTLADLRTRVPEYFDIKGRQLRVVEVYNDYDPFKPPAETPMSIRLNHPISLDVSSDRPLPVLFKGGEDSGLLISVSDDGYVLTFAVPPTYTVTAGDSLCIRHPSLVVKGEQFTDAEKEKIVLVRRAGVRRFFLSYTQCQSDIDEFRDLVGCDSEVMLKIEDKKGLEFVAREFRKCDELTLVAARGDLFVEVDRPHHILAAQRLILAHDPEAMVGSRILLSLVKSQVPSAADLSELAWLWDIGYRKFMLCDELCLKEELLATAVNVFEAFFRDYPRSLQI